jgi:NADPH-dependent reductive aminase-like protein
VASLTDLAPLLTQLAGDVDAGRHPGELANLVMDAAGVAHVAEASRTRGLDTSVIDAVHALMNRAIAAGHGGDGFTRVTDVIREVRVSRPAAAPSGARAGHRG